MTLRIQQTAVTDLEEYAAIPISFVVSRRLVASNALGLGTSSGFTLREAVQLPSYMKDYDAIAGNHPSAWPERFDVSQWAMFTAWDEDRRVGGAVVAHDVSGVDPFEGRSDLAILWDIRVASADRQQGIGTALVALTERWASSQGCTEIKVETQNINVPACRFYTKCDFALRTVNPSAYPELPDEVQLLWYKPLLWAV